MEWEIVTVIIALVGLLATVTKPIMNLTNTITKLNDTCEHLGGILKQILQEITTKKIGYTK